MTGRLAAAGRLPFAPAALALAVFALVGVAAVDDFGVSWDEELSRTYAPKVIDYVQGVTTGTMASCSKCRCS